MKVLKFGGTSVGTPLSLENVKNIVEGKADEGQLTVVVSALGGITDRLIAGANAAVKGEGHGEIFEEIAMRHRDVIRAVIPADLQPAVASRVEKLLEELFNIYRGVSLIGDLSGRTLDIIVSYGERMSSVIVSNLIKDAVLLDSLGFIKTVTQNSREVLDAVLTNRLVRETLGAHDYRVAIVPGFISTNSHDGRITNLGRGGSDYTAAIIAAAFGADSLEIWTDVDGFMTADPRVINKTYRIDRLSFIEAMELCHFGAKVIYPPTIYPVYHANIPVYIRNTFNPSAPGTLITRETPSRDSNAVKGISSINDTCLVTVSGLGMVGVKGINARIFSALTRAGVSVFLVAQASSENNTSIGVRDQDGQKAIDALCEEFAPEIASGEINPVTARTNLATIAIVGENMKYSPGVAGRLFNTLGRNGIGVVAFARGASGINISVVIEQSDLRKSLNVLHDALFLSDSGVLNIFLVGVGNVGAPLLKQIAAQQERLIKEKALRLQIVGIANSRKCYFDREGINLDNYRNLLEHSELKVSPELILDEILKMNIYNPVFVDCTSSAAIAALYPQLLSHNVNVVAANKTAASGDLANYLNLKHIAKERDVKFLFETNVGAGLPIINTINSLINSGDRILKIEAVLSGTLNYIFNTIAEDVTMSDAVAKAVEAGYAEPDPRVDLSGYDVIRKIVILGREAGYAVSCEDTDLTPILPAEVMNTAGVDEFMDRLHALDPQFEKMRREAVAENARFRFIATLENGRLSARLAKVLPSHPFYSLEGSNNIILLTTERYHEFPMEIKGYGAGAEVTAAGVFADIISIANIR